MRVAIAGATGFIGPVHARAARLAGAEVVGVSASSPERAREAAQALRVERAFDTPEALVGAEGVDVVHICTPNHLHAPLAEAALAAGKHAVCEKPLATTAAEAERLLGAAENRAHPPRVATVPFVYRYNATVREARARVAAGEIGAVRLVHGGYLQDWLSSAEDDNWRVDPAQSGASRAFADIGSHWCDLMEFVTGDRIAAVCAQTATVVGERAERGHAPAFAPRTEGGPRRPVVTEDLATMLFRTAAGVVGTMLVSQVSPGRKNHLHLEIAGAEASVRFEQEHAETLWIGRRERNETVWRDPALLHPSAARVTSMPPGHAEGYTGCFDAFVADTYTAIASGTAPDGMPRFADGARSARIVDAVVQSARAGAAWVEL